MTAAEPKPGERWRFKHYGLDFDIEVTDVRLDGDVIHGTLVSVSLPAIGSAGDLVVVPTASVRSGERVNNDATTPEGA